MFCAPPLALHDGDTNPLFYRYGTPTGFFGKRDSDSTLVFLSRGLSFQKRIRNTIFTGIADYIGTTFQV